jgi:hypothetical protein
MRAPDYSSGKGYFFGVTCDGRYNLKKSDGSGDATLINTMSNNMIKPGTNQTNRIGVMLVNDSFTLYANGKKIGETKDTGISEGGYIGPFFAGISGGFTVTMDEIAYWDLP